MSLFVRMLREEWRLNTHLFRGDSFAVFPLAVAALTAGGTWLLSVAGTGEGAVLAGLHGLLAFFGLQVGTVGLLGRDALRDALGDVTPLVFAARTLPLSWRRLLATFLLKDLLYYSVLFVTPVVAGYGAVAVATGTSPGQVALAWLTVTAAFGLGVTVTLALAGLAMRSRLLPVALVAAVGVVVLATGVDVLRFTPWELSVDPGIETAVTATAPIPILGLLGVWLFEPVESDRARGSRRLLDRLLARTVQDWPTRRSLLSVSRSSGSIWKVLFSMGVLFVVTAVALDRVTATTGLTPAPGIAFGTLLGLGAFTTYSWVATFADAREHLRYPQLTGDVFRAAGRAYIVLSVATGLPYLALATVRYDPLALLPGVVILPLVATYVFGVAAYLTGFSPNEVLFDTPRFLAFGVALALLALPLLVAALAISLAPGPVTVGAVLLSGVGAAVGVALTRRAGPRWNDRLRS